MVPQFLQEAVQDRLGARLPSHRSIGRSRLDNHIAVCYYVVGSYIVNELGIGYRMNGLLFSLPNLYRIYGRI